MARRALSPACLAVVQRVAPHLAAGRVVVACSGGADSLALAAAAAHLVSRGRSGRAAVSACVVDHGLQPDSAAVASRVVEQLTGLGLTARSVRVRVPDPSPLGMEAAARDARYAALAELAAAGGRVLLGHTLDDQAETVLLGLARGSGTRSLAGMAAEIVIAGARFTRPLLDLRRTTTARACADWELPVWQDPHNRDPAFARVRVRERVLPVLEAELGPGVAEALARTARLARADADELDARAADLLSPPGSGLAVALVASQPDALAGRLVRGWLIAQGVPEPDFGHVEAVRGLVRDWRGQNGIDLPGGFRVVRQAGMLRLDARA